VLSPAIGLSCHRHPRKPGFRELDAGVEASGPHDFTVRVGTFRQKRIRVHRIPCRVDDVAQRPSVARDGALRAPDLPDMLSEIFLQKGLDSEIVGSATDLPVGQRPALVRCPLD
jgi:hypothetical protein